MVPWTAGCGYQVFFLNFKVFISRFDFQNVYEKPNWPNFSNFWTQKNPNNKYFRKSFCIYKKRILSQKRVHIQKTNTTTKNFCDTPLLICGTRCGIVFRISTIIFRNANTTYSNEHNLIVFSRVFWKYFCGIPGTENTPARVQKCFWNDKNTKKWVSGHNTQCQNNQCHNTQCDI